MSKVKVNGIELYYEVHGEGDPFVLIHGADATLKNWGKQVSLFSKKNKLILYDNRGFGRSETPEKGYSRDIYADDLHGLLRYLGINKAAILGYSMGGGTALSFTLKYQEMVKALILVDTGTGGFAMDEERRKRMLTSMELAKTKGMEEVFDLTMNVFSPDFLKNHPEEVSRYRALFAENSAEAYVRRAQESLDNPNPPQDLAPRLSENKVPTLLIFGELDTAFPNADLFKMGIPHAQLLTIPNCGHATYFEQPDLFNETVLKFLDKA
ncbi:MAG: alpha/beta hydrolase [Candidatus Tectomicrobia bacterium]|nr:alpha/beta hydrolase [Candidatus Tectomicrobia bacterium]